MTTARILLVLLLSAATAITAERAMSAPATAAVMPTCYDAATVGTALASSCPYNGWCLLWLDDPAVPPGYEYLFCTTAGPPFRLYCWFGNYATGHSIRICAFGCRIQ